MAKLFSIVCGLMLFCASLGLAETIDVNIKGIDDGRKTTRQRDYQEAVMNAKLQAIERAGASIESITKVENFQLKYDAVESKSKAILLPGFQTIDIGYVADGTYQIVLIGKIQLGEKEGQNKETPKDDRFIAYNNGTVLDKSTNLMWAAKDNGRDINWSNARSYCNNYRGGGHTDWRMPILGELAGLYDAEIDNNRLGLTKLITLSNPWIWASETKGSDASGFAFGIGGSLYLPQSSIGRALPVRSRK